MVANYVEKIHFRRLLHRELSSNQVNILLVGYLQTHVNVALLDKRQNISLIMVRSRVAEVVRGHGGPPPKSLDSDENFKPEHTLFCRELRCVAIYTLFGDLWAKKVSFGSKTAFLGQEVHYYMENIAYFTDLNFQLGDYAKKRRICCKNCKYALYENFHGHFCPQQKAAKLCYPGQERFKVGFRFCKIKTRT